MPHKIINFRKQNIFKWNGNYSFQLSLLVYKSDIFLIFAILANKADKVFKVHSGDVEEISRYIQENITNYNFCCDAKKSKRENINLI